MERIPFIVLAVSANDIQILEKSGDEWYKNEGITKEEVDAVKKRVRELLESRK